jgi:hypothetical protein
MRQLIFLAIFIPALAAAQTAPHPTSPATATPTTSSIPKNLDHRLEDLITIDADAMPLSDFARSLADLTQTNVAFNWNALAQSGITRDTPVTLHLKNLPYEQVVQTLMEILPARDATGRGNYLVADNTLEVATNADLGKTIKSKLYDLSRLVGYTFNPQGGAAELEQNRKLVEILVQAELQRAGEPMDAKGHEILSKETTMAATISDRGLKILDHALGMLAQPAKIGQLPPGVQLTAMAKHGDAALKAALAKMPAEQPAAISYVALARAPQIYADALNIALLPGTAEELAKPEPQIGHAITDGGVLLLGPMEAIESRTVMGVYDLRDLIRRIAAKSGKKPPPDAVQDAILQLLQTQIKPESGKWGGVDDLGKTPAVLVPYNGILVVFATQETQRTVAGALQDMNK